MSLEAATLGYRVKHSTTGDCALNTFLQRNQIEIALRTESISQEHWRTLKMNTTSAVYEVSPDNTIILLKESNSLVSYMLASDTRKHTFNRKY